ncbi:cytochrome c maturation protein CcmE [Desulfovibrio litoralis]|uniref:Cytochrome c-type biogenesis protein CcmE n=1 Tax=Desulfovibrio litoralis DSM 11393 TaxID=1121455 RepID=A0A1M7RSD3_9BACT|nr:cytochrome c maturation protein CcmE [Desulfovibrio litoralis]SHN49237.1 cytochrome c-type biogenesis protein CcmE [Desulfovibrio litoralis DSM 11393]
MNGKKNNKAYLIALVFFLCGAGYLIFSGFSENSIYFLNVSEALAMPTEERKAARLFGTVGEENLQIPSPGSKNALIFKLQDKDMNNQNIIVQYKGTIPDTFKAGVEVIVEGSFDQSGSNFVAKTLMTKCPSKYEKENRETGKQKV